MSHQQQIPFLIVADFEAITKKIDTCEPDLRLSYNMRYQKHEAMCFSYFIIYQHGLYKPPVVYRGKNAAKIFMETLAEDAKEIGRIYHTPKPLEILSNHQKEKHAKASTCYICHAEFTKNNYKIFKDCHLTGKYRNAARNTCNLKFRLPHFIPVFFHNLFGYDAHFIVKELDFDEKKNFSCRGKRRKVHLLQ